MSRTRSALPRAACLFLSLMLTSCDRAPTWSLPLAPAPPTAPVPPPPSPALANVSGTVWIHDAGGVRPYAGASVFAWVEINRGARSMGRAVTDADGRYLFRPETGSVLRIFANYSEYQPCAVTLDVSGDLTHDVHIVSNRNQLGARLPQALLSQSPTLSGVVFEVTPEGRRVLSDVHVTFDGTGGGADLVTASTLTDSDGRYVLCGLSRDKTGALFVSKPDYHPFFKSVQLTGAITTLDVELQAPR
jgi:hypothetical protein